MQEITISEDGILCLLRKLDIKKGSGPDRITNIFLHRYAGWVSKYLHKIYTVSLKMSSIPDDWRCANVVPIHKSGSKSDLNNYRPVSLTSTCCKVLEHIIYKAIATHIDQNDLLSHRQRGFRSGFSTVTQLAELMHDIANEPNKGGQIDAISFLSKAFDVVPHADLITKL